MNTTKRTEDKAAPVNASAPAWCIAEAKELAAGNPRLYRSFSEWVKEAIIEKLERSNKDCKKAMQDGAKKGVAEMGKRRKKA